MLIKLLKYDLKYMLKNMMAFYILAIFFSLTTRLLFNVDQSIIIIILGQISLGLMISMIVNILINTMMRSWIRFRDSIYKDESYLTHTLPVTKSEIYNSKFLQTLIFFFVSFAIIVLSLFIAFYSNENWILFTDYIKSIISGLNMSITFFIIIAILIIFLEIFNAIQCGFYAIILGYKSNSRKVSYSILLGFIFYLITQLMVLSLVFIYGLFDQSIMDLFKTNVININVNSFKVLAIITSILYSIIIIVMNILCVKELNKGVNVE